MKTRFGLAGLGAIGTFGVLALAIAGCAGEAASGVMEPPVSPMAPAPAGMEQQASAEAYPAAPAAAAPAPPSAAAPPGAWSPGGSPAASAAEPPPSARSAEVERAPSQRPGLGTEWGEKRYSQVHDEPFLRAGSDPFAVAAVRYDDRAGVDAMIAQAPRSWDAHLARGGSIPLANGWITLSVRGEHGEVMKTLRFGDGTYVVGRAGERYTLVLSNRTNQRFEAVATVDGLDVINGRSGSLANRGYLLDPHATLEIDGFRENDDTVAAFRFGRVADSYAAQTGSARDVGVIGVAFFAERGDVNREDEARLRQTASPFPNDPRYAQPPPF